MLYTLCLNFILLIVLFSPALIMQSIFGSYKRSGLLFSITAFNAMLIIVVYPFLDKKVVDMLKLSISNYMDWMIGIVSGVILLLIEIMISHITTCIKERKFIKLNLSVVGISEKRDIILSLVNAVFEELIYRWIWIGILLAILKTPSYLAIIISSVAFAYNHRLLGAEIFFAKLMTAIILGSLYVYSNNILVPVLGHMIINLIVGIMSCRRKYV